ncbi:MAG: phage terminase small subunit P27 family [Ruminococcus sp.]|nr:phage terminase small subunit P27 family [Ruminococcus sp.]
MANQRQPIELIMAKGKKHLTKTEINSRLNTEIKPLEDEIIVPNYLTSKQKKDFSEIASQLQRLKIMSITDVDNLARYIQAKDIYLKLTKEVNKLVSNGDLETLTSYVKLQDKYAKQCHTFASSLGLTITSRCKLVVPVVEDTPKTNKFEKFMHNVG